MRHHRVLSTIQTLICRNQISQRWCINFCPYWLYFESDVPSLAWHIYSILPGTSIPHKGREAFLFACFVFCSVPPPWPHLNLLCWLPCFLPNPCVKFPVFRGKLWTEYIQQGLDCFFSSWFYFTVFLGTRKSPQWHWCSSPLFLKLPFICNSLQRSVLAHYRQNTISIFTCF